MNRTFSRQPIADLPAWIRIPQVGRIGGVGLGVYLLLSCLPAWGQFGDSAPRVRLGDRQRLEQQAPPAEGSLDLATAQLMLRDARAWAERGWFDAAESLAKRAAAAELAWPADGPTPEATLAGIVALRRGDPWPTPPAPIQATWLENPAASSDVALASHSTSILHASSPNLGSGLPRGDLEASRPLTAPSTNRSAGLEPSSASQSVSTTPVLTTLQPIIIQTPTAESPRIEVPQVARDESHRDLLLATLGFVAGLLLCVVVALVGLLVTQRRTEPRSSPDRSPRNESSETAATTGTAPTQSASARTTRPLESVSPSFATPEGSRHATERKTEASKSETRNAQDHLLGPLLQKNLELRQWRTARRSST